MSDNTQSAIEPALRIHDNPLLIAMTRRRLRSHQRIPAVVTDVLIGLCILLMAASSQDTESWKYAAGILYVGIAYLLFFRGSNQVATLVQAEMQSGILDFHRATPTTPWTDTFGYLFGLPSREYFSSGIAALFLLVCVLGGGMNLLFFGLSLVSIVISAALYHCLIMILALSGAGQRAMRGAGLVIIALLGVGVNRAEADWLAILAYLTPWPMVDAVLSDTPKIVSGQLFGISLPSFIYFLILQIPLLLFFFHGAARKVRDPQAPVFSRFGGVAFFATGLFQFLGAFWDLLGKSAGELAPSLNENLRGGLDEVAPNLTPLVMGFYLSVVLVMGLFLLYSLTPTYLSRVRALRRAAKMGKTTADPWVEGASSWPMAFILATLATAGLIVLILSSGLPPTHDPLTSVMVIVSFFVSFSFVAGCVEYCHMTLKRNWKSGVAFVAFLSLILPWMMTGVGLSLFGKDSPVILLAQLSPLWGMASAGAHFVGMWQSDFSSDMETTLGMTLSSLIITGIVAGWFYYRAIEAAGLAVKRLPPAQATT